MDAFPHQDGLLMALRASLPGKDLHFAELDSPPRNVLLLRLSRILVKEAEKRLKPVDHVTHLGEPATKLLGAKFSRLAPYFEGLTVADVAQVSPEDLPSSTILGSPPVARAGGPRDFFFRAPQIVDFLNACTPF